MGWKHGARGAAVLLIVLSLVACRKERPTVTSSPEVENKVAMRTVELYFEGPEMLLLPERRDIALPENAAAALSAVLRELLKGSASEAVPRLLPADTELRAAYLLPDGTTVIDLGGPTLTEGWSTGTHQELMAIQSVVHTVVANFPEARSVRLLVNGSPAETLGGHVWLGRALVPAPATVRRQS